MQKKSVHTLQTYLSHYKKMPKKFRDSWKRRLNVWKKDIQYGVISIRINVRYSPIQLFKQDATSPMFQSIYQTPLTIPKMPFGFYQLKVSHQGYQRILKPFHIQQACQKISLQIFLKKVSAPTSSPAQIPTKEPPCLGWTPSAVFGGATLLALGIGISTAVVASQGYGEAHKTFFTSPKPDSFQQIQTLVTISTSNYIIASVFGGVTIGVFTATLICHRKQARKIHPKVRLRKVPPTQENFATLWE